MRKPPMTPERAARLQQARRELEHFLYNGSATISPQVSAPPRARLDETAQQLIAAEVQKLTAGIEAKLIEAVRTALGGKEPSDG